MLQEKQKPTAVTSLPHMRLSVSCRDREQERKRETINKRKILQTKAVVNQREQMLQFVYVCE